ncbi:MAG: response regulator, partial [Candidatus Omnitrophica bacterium]|nr:response regulator [Candidatus Omnitrophota bacterium]
MVLSATVRSVMTNKRIMVVDDDKEFLEELRETLVLSGYEVKTVSDACDAFPTAMRAKPDLILLDLKMKGMTGFEVANKLKNYSGTMEIPIIAMSGFFTADEDDTLLSFFQIQNYLRKPFNPLDIITRIENIFKENQRRKN